MYNLLHKNFLIQKKYSIFAMLYGMVVFIFFIPLYSNFAYSMGAFGITYMLFMTFLSFDAKNKTEIVLNSLPLVRSDIVRAQFLSTLAYTVFSLLLMTLTGLLIKVSPLSFQVPSIRGLDVVITIISISILVSVALPIYHRFPSGSIFQIVHFILFLFFFFVPSYIGTFIKGNINESWVQQLLQLNLNSPWFLPLIGIIAAALFLIVSYPLSVKYYTAKEL